MTSQPILHLVPAAEFDGRPEAGAYRPRQFAQDGFIHCTATAEVLRHVANSFYRDVPGDFLVLVIDPARLESELRYEAPMPPAPAGSPLANVLFPHVYGPLNREAFVAVRRAERAADGTFVSFG